MNYVFRDASDKPLAFARQAGTPKSRIQVVLDRKQGISIDILAQLADALDCEAYQLLIPPEHQHLFSYPVPRGSRSLESDVNVVHEDRPKKASKYQASKPRR